MYAHTRVSRDLRDGPSMRGAMGANVVVCACECLYARAMREGVVGWMDG